MNTQGKALVFADDGKNEISDLHKISDCTDENLS
jgi:hypothetical protein